MTRQLCMHLPLGDTEQGSHYTKKKTFYTGRRIILQHVTVKGQVSVQRWMLKIGRCDETDHEQDGICVLLMQIMLW